MSMEIPPELNAARRVIAVVKKMLRDGKLRARKDYQDTLLRALAEYNLAIQLPIHQELDGEGLDCVATSSKEPGTRECKNCLKVFVPRRRNQHFCRNQCRIGYHNQNPKGPRITVFESRR